MIIKFKTTFKKIWEKTFEVLLFLLIFTSTGIVVDKYKIFIQKKKRIVSKKCKAIKVLCYKKISHTVNTVDL